MSLKTTIKLLAALSLIVTLPAQASSFGVYDARTQALGGTGVAMGDLANGFHYNPAITALHKGDEDKTRDGRHSIPAFTSQYSDGAKVAAEAIRDDLEGRLSAAIDNYNAAPGPQTASNGKSAAVDLESAMQDLQGEDILGDIYLGYSVTEPSHLQGGAFYFGSRLVGAGLANIENDDIELVGDYIEALDYISSDGAEGEEHPELFLADGRLADPTDDILSSARGRAAIISEIGISGGKLFNIRGHAIAFGVTPKAVNLRLYDDEWQVIDGDYESSGTHKEYWHMNLDAGVLWAMNDHWHFGLTSKNMIPRNYESDLGYRFKFKPQTRIGGAYKFAKWHLGADLDLYPNHTFVDTEKQQELSIGAEYALLQWLSLRAGYRHDLQGTFKDSLSLGFGTRWRRLYIDMAIITGSNETGFGLQLGIAQ